jgi:hypothetical protein
MNLPKAGFSITQSLHAKHFFTFFYKGLIEHQYKNAYTISQGSDKYE